MKQIERSAILTRDYAKARLVHEEIDGRVRQEHQAQQRRLNADHCAERLHLLQRHQNELCAIRSQKALERDVIERKHANDLELLQRRKAALHIDSQTGPERRELPNQACWMRPSTTTLEIDPLLPPVAEKPKERERERKTKRPRVVVRDTITFHPLTMPNRPDSDQKYSTRFSGTKRFRYATSYKSETSHADSEVILGEASRQPDEVVEKPPENVRVVEEEHDAEPGMAVEAEDSGGEVKAVHEDRPPSTFMPNHVIVFDTGTEYIAESVETGPGELSELEPAGSHDPAKKERND
jgi:hypothetical protein